MTSSTLDELARTERAFRRYQAKADTLREQRNALVREAVRQGCTHAQIAAATGLTRGRIGQLAST